MNKGEFITLEGIEGAGKTSAVACVADTMKSLGRNVVVTREPGGTEIGEGIRSLILEQRPTQMRAKTELLLMFAARAQHLDHGQRGLGERALRVREQRRRRLDLGQPGRGPQPGRGLLERQGLHQHGRLYVHRAIRSLRDVWRIRAHCGLPEPGGRLCL